MFRLQRIGHRRARSLGPLIFGAIGVWRGARAANFVSIGVLDAKAQRWTGAALGVMAALPMMLALRGFMVDDALISARYAANIASGAGYVLNPGERPSDGVTPLGWAYLLAPFARGAAAVVQAFLAAKWIGAIAWLIGAAGIGAAIGDAGAGASAGAKGRWGALGVLALSAPMGAWAVAGMETGVVLGLGAGAAMAQIPLTSPPPALSWSPPRAGCWARPSSSAGPTT